MFITICVIAYNEEQTLPAILKDIAAQDYAHGSMEVVLVDSASSDHTKKIMQEFAAQNTTQPDMGFVSVSVLDNPKRTLPCGWNVALKAYRGEAILKVDAHASIPKDFVTKNVAVLESGEDVCGGQRPNIIEQPTPFRNTLLLGEISMFGSGIAPYRNNPGKSYVKSMFHAAYRRKVFESIGGFDERLARTEDNEIHYRMRKAGFKLCFDPEIISYQHIRPDLGKMLKQKYANGYWIGLTTGVWAPCLSLYHFVPFAFVLGIIATTIFGIFVHPFPAVLMWSLYWLLAIVMAVVSVRGQKKDIRQIALPVLFFLLHISYGVGTCFGFLSLLKRGKERKSQ